MSLTPAEWAELKAGLRAAASISKFYTILDKLATAVDGQALMQEAAQAKSEAENLLEDLTKQIQDFERRRAADRAEREEREAKLAKDRQAFDGQAAEREATLSAREKELIAKEKALSLRLEKIAAQEKDLLGRARTLELQQNEFAQAKRDFDEKARKLKEAAKGL